MKEKVHELRDDELQQKLESLKTELFNLRFSHATGQLSNPLQIQNVRRDIARVAPCEQGGEVMATERNERKTREGVVVSDKMDKTVVVSVVEKYKHPLYKKTVTRTKRFKAHDESNECGVGDRVEIIETRPISKDKCWRVNKIVEKAK